MSKSATFESVHQSKCKRACVAPTKNIVHPTSETNVENMPCSNCDAPSAVVIYDFKQYVYHAREPEMAAPLMSLCKACSDLKIERCFRHDMDMMELYNYFHWKE